MIRSVIFDLDGTLIDSMSIWSSIDRKFLLENGVKEPPADISDIMRKLTVDEAAQYFISEFRMPHTKEYVIGRIEELVRDEYEHNIQLKPHVHETLDRLDGLGIPYCVATATYRGLAEAVLKRCGIFERFRFIATDAEYPSGKTCPDIFLGCAGRMGCAPDETMVVEDSLHCIETASAAGFFTVGIFDDYSAPERSQIEKAADKYIMSLDEMFNIM